MITIMSSIDKHPKDYTQKDVTDFLHSIGLGHKAQVFEDNAVDGSMLDTLTQYDLKNELGFSNLQARKFNMSYEKVISGCVGGDGGASTTKHTSSSSPSRPSTGTMSSSPLSLSSRSLNRTTNSSPSSAPIAPSAPIVAEVPPPPPSAPIDPAAKVDLREVVVSGKHNKKEINNNATKDANDDNNDSSTVDVAISDKTTTSKRRKEIKSPMTKCIPKMKNEDNSSSSVSKIDPAYVAMAEKVQNTNTCPHCKKIFKSQFGMKDHIDRLVCRGNLEKDQALDSAVTSVQIQVQGKMTLQNTNNLPIQCNDNYEEEKGKVDYAEKKEANDGNSGGHRRSKRRKRTKSTTYEDDNDNYDDDVVVVKNMDIDGFENENEEENQYDSCTKKRQKKQKRKNNTKISSKPAQKKLNCPHCEHTFKTKNGLQYHIDNKACRIEECTDLKIIAKTKNKYNKKNRSNKISIEPSVGLKKCKTNIGVFHNRTCPNCKAVFTSAHGRNYHVIHKVCQMPNSILMSRATASVRVRQSFHALSPGDRFVTPFGIVEVVKDDRAVPTAKFPKDIQQQNKKYKKVKYVDEKKQTLSFIKRSSKLRIRRNEINVLYERKGKANRRSIFEAYFDGDPVFMKSVISANKALVGSRESIKQSFGSSDAKGGDPADPTEPPDSFPDRIVECIGIIDQRSHVLALSNDFVKRNAKQLGTFFLQRRLLTKRYVENDRVYNCSDCDQKFCTTQSRKAHVDRKQCIQKARIDHTKREEISSRIEKEIADLIRFPIERKFPTKRKNAEIIVNDQKRKKKKKKVETSIYPEVLLCLGFKLVAKSIPYENDSSVIIFKNNSSVSAKATKIGDEPELVLQNLQVEFQKQQRKADDQKYGSMYAKVYKTLKFKSPNKKKGANVGNMIGKKLRRKRLVKPKPPLPFKPILPSIDTRALVDEVGSGRYPSINRYVEGAYDDLCVICKKDGDLLCCNFCHRVEHLKCIRQKFTIKEPEPEEDFMCHKCIQTVLCRRARAEKRRLRKHLNNEDKNKQEVFDENRKNLGDGKEYHYMAAQAQEVNELVELLKDSQLRLRRSIETTKVNSIRRGIISGGVYPLKIAHASARVS